MSPIRNIFACLVHESSECVIDLARNLHFADPSSIILLYNGGQTPDLLKTGFPFDTCNAIVHPSPKPMEWGRLHDFALDCMQFALDELTFDTITIVDSDQMATRCGFSEYLTPYIRDRQRLGMLGNSPGVQHPTTSQAPAQTAFRELELWRPYLRRFPNGEQKFVHWSFWPSTVFTNAAAWELTRLFSTDRELTSIMSRSAIWATEELVLPTLLALLDYEIAANPCSSDYVKYKTDYTLSQIDAALNREDVFWVHPVPRRYDNSLRKRIRESLGYHMISSAGATFSAKTDRNNAIVLSVPILKRMKKIQGWLEEEEADLLLAACNLACSTLPADSAVVEIGSFCGRSTVVLGSVVKSLGAQTKVFAIDSHDGMVGAAGSRSGVTSLGSTLDVFRRNIAENGLTSVIETIVKRSYEVAWEKPIGLLFIDGLHDYENVSRDFHHFESCVIEGGYIAFHDYADYYPGVKNFVDEVIALPNFELVHRAGSMIVVRKTAGNTTHLTDHSLPKEQALESRIASLWNGPASLVSCIMPTADRRTFIPQAIRHFLCQDYPNKELIILDDGADTIADLVPHDERIRYLRLDRKFSMGVKHNMACEMARGEIIVHWDDDDWASPQRISYQARELQEQSATTSQDTICGLSRVMFYDPRSQRAWEYQYPGGRPWVLGSTFCYYKKFSEQHRFPDMNEGADTTFVWNLQNVNVRAHPDHTFYVGTVHSRNTSPKRTETIGWHPLSNSEVRRLMNDKDWSFYENFERVIV
ncbi:MAG TPA: class I SAM-dependent methyltransferase [Alloacidobacterium sp.]|nr:class I SAM-dependent methyltransferase [Alloacidobacterium sp.]